MGTRAMIRIDGKDFVATHWDGNPEELGRELAALSTKSKVAILAIAKKHSIDAVDKDVHQEINEERLKMLSKKHKLPISKIKKGIRRGNIIASEDYEISLVDNYGDWAEYIYDIRGNNVYVAEGHGDYDATKQAERHAKLKWGRYVGGVGGGIGKKTIPLTKGEKGWFYDSARHALARRGIKTGRKNK